LLINDVLGGAYVVLLYKVPFAGGDIVPVYIVKLWIPVVDADQHVLWEIGTQLKYLGVNAVVRREITFSPGFQIYTVNMPVFVAIAVLYIQYVVV